jgi:cholesterol transport system auxiliary component
MKNTPRLLLAAVALISAMLLDGCAVTRTEAPTLFDLGPMRATPAEASLPPLPPIAVADVTVPNWLDRPLMFYRLNYANDQQPHPYAKSRWSMPPAQLIAQRLKARIAQAGGVVLSASDGAAGVPVLRIEADDFSQSFDAPGQSIGRIALRASAFKGRSLVAQKTFIQQINVSGEDAEGGARALAQASDAAISDMIRWLATLPLK